MGASASDVIVDRCHPSCIEACPAIAAQSELRRRQEALDKRKRASVSYSLRSIGEASGQVSESMISRTITVGKRLLAGQATLQDLRSAMSGQARKDEEEEQYKLHERLRRAAREHGTPNDDLQQGAVRGDMRRVRRALDEGASVAVANPRGVTVMMLAASSSGKDALDVVQLLKEQQADVSARDNQGWTSLHHACRNGKTEIAKQIIHYNADPTEKVADQKTALMLAAIEGKVELIRELFKVKGVREQIVDKDALGSTALHYAVKDGSVEVTRLLLEHNAKANAKDIDGKTPMIWACEYGKLDCAKQLCRRSADIDGKDKSQKTPLLYACMNSYEGLALWLIKKNADPAHRDLVGDSPVDIADENGLSEFKRAIKVRKLEEAEGD